MSQWLFWTVRCRRGSRSKRCNLNSLHTPKQVLRVLRSWTKRVVVAVIIKTSTILWCNNYWNRPNPHRNRKSHRPNCSKRLLSRHHQFWNKPPHSSNVSRWSRRPRTKKEISRVSSPNKVRVVSKAQRRAISPLKAWRQITSKPQPILGEVLKLIDSNG